MLMSSSRVRAIKLPGASTTSKFPEPVSAGASHFDIAIAVVDAARRSHIGYAHVALFAMNGQQGLLRHRDIHIDADTRAPASDSRGTHLKTVSILDDLRGHVLAHPLRSVLAPTLHIDFAGNPNFGLVGRSNNNVAPSPAHRHARIRRHRFRSHINAAGKCFAGKIHLPHAREVSWHHIYGSYDTHQREQAKYQKNFPRSNARCSGLRTSRTRSSLINFDGAPKNQYQRPPAENDSR